jgi:hypothetical protein
MVYFGGVRIRSMSKSSTWTFDHKNALKSFNSIINMNFEQYTIQSILTYHCTGVSIRTIIFACNRGHLQVYTYLI